MNQKQRKVDRNLGQGLVEYALLLALVALAVGGTVVLLGPQIGDVFSRISGGFGDGAAVVEAEPVPERERPDDTLLVTVVDGAGKGVAGVTVYAFDERERYAGQQIVTDTNGEAAFTGLPDGRYQFRATLQRHTFWSSLVNYPREWQGEIASGRQPVTVTVVDAAGLPIPGPVVHAYDAGRRFVTHGTASDSSGRVTFNLVDGEFTFRAYYRAQELWSDLLDTTQAQAALIETGEAPFTIRVVGADGEWVSGSAYITVVSETESWTGLAKWVDGGEWALSLPHGRFKLRVSYLGNLYWSETFAVPDRQAAQVNTGERPVTLRALAADGSGVPGVSLYIFKQDPQQHNGIFATSGADGTAVVPLPDGTYLLRANYRGQEYWSASFTTPNVEMAGVDVGERPFSVTVVDAAGRGISAVRVYAFTPDEQFTSVGGHTGADGVVQLALPAGSYRVRADYRGQQYWSETTPLTSGGTIISTGEGTVTVSVTADGEGVNDALVHVYDAPGSYIGVSGRTDRQGLLPVSLPAGQFDFRVQAGGRDVWSGMTAVAAGETVRVEIQP